MIDPTTLEMKVPWPILSEGSSSCVKSIILTTLRSWLINLFFLLLYLFSIIKLGLIRFVKVLLLLATIVLFI